MQLRHQIAATTGLLCLLLSGTAIAKDPPSDHLVREKQGAIIRGDVNVKPLTTHKLPIQRIDDAITAYAERPDRTLGVAIVMD